MPTENTINAYIENTNYYSRQTLVDLKVERYSWNAIGGPEEAEITVESGDPEVLREMFTWLGSKVKIRDSVYGPLWWGSIEEVTLDYGHIRLSSSLSQLVNDATIWYPDPADPTVTLSVNDTDIASQALYGLRQINLSLASADGPTATGRAVTIVRMFSSPIQQIAPGGNKIQGKLYCRGMFSRLGYRYYTFTGGATLYLSTDIITRIVTNTGIPDPFVAVRIDDASSLVQPDNNDGARTSKDVITELLGMGVTANKLSTPRRLLCTATVDDRLVVYAEPLSSPVAYYVDTMGLLSNETQVSIPLQTMRAGVWIAARDFIQPGGTPYLAFVERSEFDVSSQKWTWQPRVLTSPQQYLSLTEG